MPGHFWVNLRLTYKERRLKIWIPGQGGADRGVATQSHLPPTCSSQFLSDSDGSTETTQPKVSDGSKDPDQEGEGLTSVSALQNSNLGDGDSINYPGSNFNSNTKILI